MNSTKAFLRGDSSDFRYCPTLATTIEAGRLQGRTGKVFDGLAALSTPNNLVVLRNLCLERQPKHTLEIGLSFGGSALVFLSSHHDLGHLPGQQHVALDPYQKTVWDDCGVLLTERAGLSSYLNFRESFSSLELPSMLREKRRFDLVYIDGSHLFEDVFVDFYFVSRLLGDSGLVLFDDCSDPHVRKVIRFIQTNCAESFASFDLSRYRDDRGKSMRYVIGGLFGRRQLLGFQKIGAPVRAWNSRFSEF